MPNVRGKSRSTGPKTKHGKTRSSKNSTKHGCTSKELILPDESAEEWEALVARWEADYRPDSATFRDQVKRAAQAEWFLLRATARYNQAEQKSFGENPDPVYWTEDEHRLLELFGRYRTTAQRWFHRERQAAEQLRKARVSEAAQRDAEGAAARRPKRPEGEVATVRAQAGGIKAETAAMTPSAIVQNVEVWVDEGGRTITVKIPPDEDVRRMADGKTPPVLVRRPVYFRGAIPPEYGWMVQDAGAVQPGSRFSITMPFEEWEKAAEREKASEGGHLWGEREE